MKIIEALKKTDRTLLEMHIGMIFFGVVCQLVGAFIVQRQYFYAASLWFGIAFSIAASVHMARTLDRALGQAEAAAKIISRGYIFRYVMIVAVLAVVAITKVMDPLVVFLGYMSLKVTAYLQPLTHKVLNGLLHETDPVPEPLREEETHLKEEQASSGMDNQSEN